MESERIALLSEQDKNKKISYSIKRQNSQSSSSSSSNNSNCEQFCTCIPGNTGVCYWCYKNEQEKENSNSSKRNRNRLSITVLDSGEHCHDDEFQREIDKKARKKLWMASGLCVVLMFAEAAGGIFAGSLAIATDAAHLLTDFAGFMISLFALYISERPATKRLSYGYHRAEVIGALTSVLLIWVVTGILVYMATQRLILGDFEIDAPIMLITSGVGLIVNIIMGFTLHQHAHSHGGGGGSHGHNHSHNGGGAGTHSHSHQQHGNKAHKVPTNTTSSQENQVNSYQNSKTPNNHKNPQRLDLEAGEGIEDDNDNGSAASSTYPPTSSSNSSSSSRSNSTHGSHVALSKQNVNVRAAFIHVIGDFIQSVGVFLAAILIYFKPTWVLVDPICTYIFSVLVLGTTYAIVKETVFVLMEGIPKGIDFNDVRETLLHVKGVCKVHNLRIWSLSMDRIALSAHLAIDPNGSTNSSDILRKSSQLVKVKYGFSEVTIQIEDFSEKMQDCRKCQELN